MAGTNFVSRQPITLLLPALSDGFLNDRLRCQPDCRRRSAPHHRAISRPGRRCGVPARGVLAFIPGVTTNFDQLTFAGHESEAALLGIFNVSVLNNIVHLLFGIAGLLAARALSAARTYLIAGGFIYLALFLYGMLIDQNSAANFVPVNTADNYLHLALGIGMIALGALLGRRTSTAAPLPATAKTS